MIDEKKLIEELKSLDEVHYISSDGMYYGPYYDKDDVMAIIKSQPPAEPETKRGKWIRYEDTHENSVKYICPFCGDYTAFRDEIAESTVNGNYIYCRHCGAKNGEDQ